MKLLLIVATFLMALSTQACPDAPVCVDDTVVDAAGDVGRVVMLFSNGKAQIYSSTAGYSISKIDSLGVQIKEECSENVCLGDMVVDSFDVVGRVKILFDNGKAQIYSSTAGYSISKTGSLGVQIKEQCYLDICVDDTVIDSADVVGRVKMLFSNGKAQIYNSETGNSVSKIDSLGKSLHK